MSSFRDPVPMVAPSGWGACSGLGLPANVYVRAWIESLDKDCNALECYKAASMFILYKVVSLERVTPQRHRTYAEALERILNWSFIIGRKSVFDWGRRDIQNYLNFVENPDATWVCCTSYSRFISNRNEPYEQWAINERWKPFKREILDGAAMSPDWSVLDKERTVVLDFFSFLSSRTSYPLTHLNTILVNDIRDIIPKKRPARSLLRKDSERLVRMYSYELDWVFERVMELKKDNWRYELALFAMAIMRYSEIPMKLLCRGPNTAGRLSQFHRRLDAWYFVSDRGAPSERAYKLDRKIKPYLKIYFNYLGVVWNKSLPDNHIFRRPGSEQGFTRDYITRMVEMLRSELCQLAANYHDPNTFIDGEILRKLSLSVIRRSIPQPPRKRNKRGRPHKV